MPLSAINHAQMNDNIAGTDDLDPRAFDGPKTAGFDVASYADAGVTTRRARLPLLLTKYLVVDTVQILLQCFRVIAAVDNQRRPVPIEEPDIQRHFVRANQIAPPDVGWIEAEFTRCVIDQTVHHEDNFRPTRAAIRG